MSSPIQPGLYRKNDMLSLSQIIAELWRRGGAIGKTKEERERERAYDTVFSIVCATVITLTCAGLLCVVWSKTTLTQRMLGLVAVVGGALLLCSPSAGRSDRFVKEPHVYFKRPPGCTKVGSGDGSARGKLRKSSPKFSLPCLLGKNPSSND